MEWGDLPKRVFHGTLDDRISHILKNGIDPAPRGQGAMPLVSTTPHLDTAHGWGGGQSVIEVNVQKLAKGRTWSAAMFDEIAFENKIPAGAISRVWRSDWYPSDEVKDEWIGIRSGEGWTLALVPTKV